MALGWMTALKLVPWSDVIEATPQIVQAARRLFGATHKTTAQSDTLPSPPSGQAVDALQVLQQRVQALEQEQQESAALIQSLAEQNARVVQAVDALRARNRRLLWALAVLALLTLGLLARVGSMA
jgi:hypothetical protein